MNAAIQTSNYLKLIRIKQWIKNLFVFLPLFFSGNFFSQESFYKTSIAFISFCFACSSIYCINDVIDKKEDILHPIKKNRPVASGTISSSNAVFLSLLLLIASLAVCYFLLPFGCLGVIGIYLILNLLYVFKFKNIPILDMFIIAIGFVLRIWIDGIACDILLSPWIVLMTFLLMLLLAVAKRYDDLKLRETGHNIKRKSTNNYNFEFLNQSLGLLAAITIVCYIMYTMSESVIERTGSDYLYLTTIFVLFGILRYLQLTVVKNKSGDPTSLVLSDKYIILSVIGWIASFTYILYCPIF